MDDILISEKISENEYKDLKNTSILKTKLYVPHLRKHAVTRQRLLDKLSIYPGHKLTMVCAPAGYGKTTLVSEWISSGKLLHAWVSLDNGDNEPQKFLTYLLTAFKNIEPLAGRITLGLLETSQNLNYGVIINNLINDILAIQDDFVLVFDDYHVIHNKVIHSIMQYLLDNAPPNIHIVLLTRTKPQMRISRLRARGQVINIGMNDLRFTEEEVERFFQDTMQFKIPKDAIPLAGKRTEGWIAGLQLLGLSLQELGLEKTVDAIKNFKGNNRYIFEYLTEEIAQQLDFNISIFLYQTSVLDRFTASLCNSVTNLDNGEEILEGLYRTNLFLIPLDDVGEWYRYHHLFSEFLRSGLGNVEKQSLYLDAAKWCEENGLLHEAVEYAIASKNPIIIEQMIERAANSMLLKAEFSTLVNWIENISEERLLSNTMLAIYKGWCCFVLGRIEDAFMLVSLLENNEEIKNDNFLYGNLLALKSAVLMTRGNTGALEIGEKAIALLGESRGYFYTLAMHSLGHSYDLVGQVERSGEVFKEVLRISQENDFHTSYITSAFYLAMNLDKKGFRKESEALCQRIIDEYKEKNEDMLPISIMHVPIGILYYENDDVINAQHYLFNGMKVCSQANLLHIMGEGEWSQALLQYALGDVQGALKTLKEAKYIAKKLGVKKAILLMESTEAEIYLREGNINQALKWADEMKLHPDIEIEPYLEQMYFTFVRILIADKNINGAQTLLLNLEHSAMQGGRVKSLITINLLQAIIMKMTSNDLKANQYLKKSVEYAAYEEYYRCFLNEGKVILEMLPKVRNVEPKFIDNLVMKFKNEYQRKKYITNSINSQLVDSLSEREMEILKLICLGLSNEGISKELCITLGTAKNHITSIYSKLGVQKRIKAINKAKELKII